MRIMTLFLLICGLALFHAGCGGETGNGSGKKSGHDHDHDHDHDHGDHIGANNPHKIELKDAPFNALWEHAGDLVTIRIVDNEYKKEVAIKTKELVVADEGGKNTFSIPALKVENGEASVFEKEDKKLLIIMDAKPTLTVEVDGKKHQTTIIHMH